MTVGGSPGCWRLAGASAVNQRDYIFFISKLNCPEAVIEALSVNDTTCVTIVRLGKRIGPGFRANPEAHRSVGPSVDFRRGADSRIFIPCLSRRIIYLCLKSKLDETPIVELSLGIQ